MKMPSFLQSNPPCFLFLFLLALLALTFLAYTSEFSLQPFLAKCPSNSLSSSSMTGSLKKPELRLLIGIFSLADRYERRQLIRNSYWEQSGDYFHLEVDIRFILCNISKEEDSVLVALEIMRYDDIIILDCVENMSEGKTYRYFSSLPVMFDDHSYDYVMKCDDDTYLRIDNLVESLRSKPREDVYYGIAIPCEMVEDNANFRNTTYMSGLGYVISWDLVEWIATTDMIKNQTDGVEDVLLGKWLNNANKGRNRFHIRPEIYDFKGELYDLCFRHDFIPETIGVHQLKQNLKWARTLKYFNVTKGLKPSKWYHIE
ncbi:hypothetical protein LUZ60_008150 [Juncus effusus]|nr:hypothetical protein LUZ60_008150 [Juncus effusus]